MFNCKYNIISASLIIKFHVHEHFFKVCPVLAVSRPQEFQWLLFSPFIFMLTLANFKPPKIVSHSLLVHLPATNFQAAQVTLFRIIIRAQRPNYAISFLINADKTTLLSMASQGSRSPARLDSGLPPLIFPEPSLCR